MSAADASALSLWSWISLLGIALVFVGVLFEGAELVVRVMAFFKRKRLRLIWNILPETHVPRWAHLMDHVGWFILIVGLGLEWRGHVRIEEITDRENRRLSTELDKAVRDSGEANKLAAELNVKANQIE